MGHRAADHDVAAVGQRALRQRLKGAAPHEDGVARGELLEAALVFADVVNQLVVEADGAVFGHGRNQSDMHSLKNVLDESDGDLCGDVGPGVVVLQFEVLVAEVEDALDVGVDAHRGQRPRGARELQSGLIQGG